MSVSEQVNLDCQNNKEVFWLMKLEARGRQASVQFSCSVMCDSLRSHGLQHTRLPCPSPTPGACSDACPLSRWCHPRISSSVVPFSSLLQSFPAMESFPMSQFFASGGQSIGVSASASVLPIQWWFNTMAYDTFRAVMLLSIILSICLLL